MSNSCDTCGYRNAEVKAGGGISEQGSTATLAVQEEADLQRRGVLQRDVMKVGSTSQWR